MQIKGLFEILRASAIFSILDDKLLKEIENKFYIKSYSHGDKIITKESFEHGYYLIFSGMVQVIKEDSFQNKKLAILKKGDSFGEQSIMSDIEDESTYIAGTDTVIAFLPKEIFIELMFTHEGFAQFLKAYSANNALQSFLKNFGSYGSLSPEEMAKWLSQLTFEEPMENGEVIFNEGDEGDKFYIVATGSVDISKNIGGTETFLVNLTEGKFFGEMALVSNSPRAATATCSGTTMLISLNKEKFLELLEENPILSEKINNIIEMYKASDAPKNLFASTKEDDYDISSKDFEEFKEAQKDFVLQKATTPITAAISAINLLATKYKITYNKKTIFELIQSDNLDEISDLLNDIIGIKANKITIDNDKEIKRLQVPFLIKCQNTVCVVYEKKGKKYKIANPMEGLSEIEFSKLSKMISKEAVIIEPPVQKEFKDNKLTFMSFIGILIPYKRILIEILTASFFITLLSLLPPVFIRVLIDDVIVNKNEQMLWVIMISLVIVAVFTGILQSLRAYLQFYLEGRLQVAILGRFYRHLVSLPLSFFLKKHSGDILADFEDGKDAEKFLARTTLTILIDGITVLALFLAMFIANSKLFFIFLTFISFFGGIIFLYTYIIRQYMPKTLIKGAKTERSMLDAVNNIKVLKTFNNENYSRNIWEQMYINKFSNTNKYIMINAISESAVLTMRTLTLAVLLGYASMMALSGEISIGEALAFNMIAMLVLVPFGKLIQVYNDINTAAYYASGLNKVYSIEEEWNKQEQNKPNLILQNSNIEFKNVDFSYEGRSKKIISNFSLFIPEKKYTALVGPIGSGKSSILNLLTRISEANSGEILISDQNISQINLKSLRSKIGIVFQEAQLMTGTIKENIQYGNTSASLSQIIEAATLAGAHEFIAGLPDGYETKLGENGTGLSGGQKRLIAVSRALVSDPSILIMDEPTNDFDTETEQVFLNNLKTIAVNRTLIIITHRPSLIRNADHIALIDEGKVIETGNHGELISKKGFYFYLLSKQLKIS